MLIYIFHCIFLKKNPVLDTIRGRLNNFYDSQKVYPSPNRVCAFFLYEAQNLMLYFMSAVCMLFMFIRFCSLLDTNVLVARNVSLRFSQSRSEVMH